MEFVGVRERQIDRRARRPCISLALTQSPSDSISLGRSPVRPCIRGEEGGGRVSKPGEVAFKFAGDGGVGRCEASAHHYFRRPRFLIKSLVFMIKVDLFKLVGISYVEEGVLHCKSICQCAASKPFGVEPCAR